MDGCPTYKFVLYPGNNPTVIQEALANRKVWFQLPYDRIMQTNLIWRPLNFPASLYENFSEIIRCEKNRSVLLNHFENNVLICTKSGLVRSLKHYYSHDNSIYQQNYHVFETIPTTFIINPNKESSDLKDFLERFAELEEKNYTKQKVPSKHCEKNIWYVKPEASNQGRGITLTNNLKEIESIIFAKATNRSYVVQKAIEKPLLLQGRKFDVRVWALVTGSFEIYIYKTPYIRTSSYEYDDTIFDQFIHLTNNCQQKHFSQYSKYEEGNTVPFARLKDILSEMGKTDPEEISNKILERMKALVVDCFLSVRKFFLKNGRKKEFELFGFDFLIDEDLRTWLLEVNNNPYLGIPNKFIKELLPEMINQMFEIVLDPLFPPSSDYKPVENRNYELLHKQMSVYRINQVRGGSIDSKRKDYYPLEDFSINNGKDQSHSKGRRNSEAVGVQSMHTTEKNIKIRYSTPSQSIKYLLDTYCFNDLQPFVVPVNFIMTSPRLEEKDLVQINLKNIRLITQTRICSILLQPKFLLICKKLLQSETVVEQIKISLLGGLTNAIRNHKHRVIVIKNIVPNLTQIAKLHDKRPNTELTEDKLLESIILLLVRLGGIVNRKIFIPGESREKQSSREVFITSNTLKILLNYKENFPLLCAKEVAELMSNLNEKDWELYNTVGKGEENIEFLKIMPQIMEKGNGHNISLVGLDDKQFKFSYREKLESINIKHILKLTTMGTLPKIKK